MSSSTPTLSTAWKSQSRYLCKQGFEAEFYHGKCEDKPARLERFASGKVKGDGGHRMPSGLGVNIPDIRLVILMHRLFVLMTIRRRPVERDLITKNHCPAALAQFLPSTAA